MNRRLQQFLNAENITQARFATMIHVTPASISHILDGRNRPGFDFIQNTMKAFPDLNIEWLINGQGKMYKTAGTPVRTEDPGDMPDSLFSDEFPDEMEVRPSEAPEADVPRTEKKRAEAQTSENIAAIQREDSPSDMSQTSVKQRKAIKIVIFYDDGTFQELR